MGNKMDDGPVGGSSRRSSIMDVEKDAAPKGIETPVSGAATTIIPSYPPSTTNVEIDSKKDVQSPISPDLDDTAINSSYPSSQEGEP